MKYPLITSIIGHGATDIIDMPLTTLALHGTSFLLINNLNILQRKLLLLSTSIIHMTHDMPLFYSILMHGVWLYKPILAKLYLSTIHTPLHYYRTLSNVSNSNKYLKISVAFITTTVGAYILENNYNILISHYLGTFWWVAPVCTHILINELIVPQKHSSIEQIITTLIKDKEVI